MSELRTWQKIDGPPDDLRIIDLLNADGEPIERWSRRLSIERYWTDPTGRFKRQTWSQIRARGAVREVPEAPRHYKSAHSCRVCRRWLEGEWSSAAPPERVELQRQMDAGHCDRCHAEHCGGRAHTA